MFNSHGGKPVSPYVAASPEATWVHHEALMSWYGRLPTTLLLEHNTKSETLIM